MILAGFDVITFSQPVNTSIKSQDKILCVMKIS